jgi:hypothetical protein
MMDRRAFISGMTLSLLAAPLAADAQPAGTVPQIGVIVTATARRRRTSSQP